MDPGSCHLRLTGTALFQLSYGGMFVEFWELDSNQRAPGPKPGRDAVNPPQRAGQRLRTDDLLITSQALCQLS